MNKSQRQRGGSGSQQIQVSGDFVIGVSESRAAEIAQEQARIAIRELTIEAARVATDRIDDLDQRVVSELQGRGLLEAFSDPAFQILLRKTQLHAAATEADTDHEILSKLLAERAQKPTKPMHMVVSRAVEVVEQIDPMALRGMTCLWFVTSIVPNSIDPKAGLSYFDSLASNVVDGDLPIGIGWLQRLDLLNCIQYQPPGGVQQLKNWHEILCLVRPGHVCEGVTADAESVIREKLYSIHPGLATWLVPHPFLPGHFRINTGRMADFLAMFKDPMEKLGRMDELQGVLAEANVDIVSTDAIANMLEFVKTELPHLERVRLWWDELQGGVGITPVGVAIGYSNAKRLGKLIGLSELSSMIEN